MLNQFVKIGLPAWILLMFGSCLPMSMGCTFKTKDNANWEFFFGTQVGTRTSSSTTSAQGEVATEFPSLESWIFSKAKVAEAEVASETDNVKPSTGTPVAPPSP